jgi:hypothetical protein
MFGIDLSTATGFSEWHLGTCPVQRVSSSGIFQNPVNSYRVLLQ